MSEILTFQDVSHSEINEHVCLNVLVFYLEKDHLLRKNDVRAAGMLPVFRLSLLFIQAAFHKKSVSDIFSKGGSGLINYDTSVGWKQLRRTFLY